MPKSFYHPAWKVYYHEILEAAPWLKYSEAQQSLSMFIKNAGDAHALRKYCAPCARAAKEIRAVKRALRAVKCPTSCPIRCPNHQQITLEFPS